MPLIDNRPGSGSGGGGLGPGDIDTVKDEVKTDWKNFETTMVAMDFVNTYIVLPAPPQDTKVLVSVLGVGPLEQGLDYTVNVPSQRVEFLATPLAKLLETFNKYGAGSVIIKTAYYAAT